MEGIGAKGLKTKLIINYLPQSMSDSQFEYLFASVGPVASSRVMRDKATSYSFGYGFIDYENPEHAEQAIMKLNGHKVDNKTLRVAYSKPPGSTKNVNLYVSGLSPTFDENKLKELFSKHGEVINTKILRERDNSSKGVGFVLFKEKSSADAALRVLQGYGDGYGTNLQDGELMKVSAIKEWEGWKTCMYINPFSVNDSFEENFWQPSTIKCPWCLTAPNFPIKYAKDPSEQQRAHPKYHEFIQSKIQQNQPTMQQSYTPIGYGMVAPQYNHLPGTYVEATVGASYGGGYTTIDYGNGELAGMGAQKAMRGRGGGARYNPIARPTNVGGMGLTLESVEQTPIILFVYNIGPNATESDLYGLFSRFGRITKVNVIEGKGYGFVHMPIPMEASEAVKSLNGMYHNGKTLQVSVKSRK